MVKLCILGLLASTPLVVLSYLNVRSSKPFLYHCKRLKAQTDPFYEKGNSTRIEDVGRENGIHIYKLQSPLAKKLPQKNIEAVYFDTAQSADAILLSALAAMIINSPISYNDLVACGLDSELDTLGRVALIQLCINDKAVLIHRKSGLFHSEYLRKFFLNELFPGRRIVFTGAELATSDALDLLHIGLPIYGLLDLTPIFSQTLKTAYKPPINFYDESDHVLSLKDMFNSVFGSHWLKDRKISKSDWSTMELSLPQVSYAVLDAWTSAALGKHALQTLQRDGIYKMIFATNKTNELAIHSDDELLLKQIMRQTRELENLKTQESKCVDIENMRVSPRGGDIEINCFNYGNRLHKNVKTVEIRIFSPGGATQGVSLLANVIESKGKVSKITLDLESLDELDLASTAHSPEDQLRMTELHTDAVHHIVEHWIAENDKLGRHSQRNDRQEQARLSERLVRVRLYCRENPDELLRQVRAAVSSFVRSYFVRWDFFPMRLRLKVIAERAAIKALRIEEPVQSHSMTTGGEKTVFLLAWSFLNGREFENDADFLTDKQRQAIESYIDSNSINPSQYKALQNAFKHKVSVIKGPPGTGKTRTIAAIADVAQKGNKRVLILAPGNSASRRILESLVKSGCEAACLVVSEDYFYEWHELAYTAQTLGEYVHTKASFNDTQKSKKKMWPLNWSAKSRAHVDFRPRDSTVHPNKWMKVAKGESADIETKPAVVIGTYGTIALNGYSTASGDWPKQVKNLLGIGAIDVLIVDETSQLWLGFGKSLLPRLTDVKNIVLVGDNAQLAPHGEGKIEHLKSLFDAAAKHPSVPYSVLNVTYRLTEPVTQILSKDIYDGGLVCERVKHHDMTFLRNMKAVLEAPTACNRSVDCNLLLQRFCETGKNGSSSLNWIHIQSPAHENTESHSLGNQQESEVVVSCVAQLLTDLDSIKNHFPLDKNNPAATKVVIITGYLEQKALIERDLCYHLSVLNYRGMNSVELSSWVQSSMIVNTVDSFQGQEADIVFVSTVRSLINPKLKGLGFARDQRRATVMLSRSSQLMIIVGDAINAALEQRTPPLLLPSMSYWCSDNNNMFKVDGNSLSSFHLPTPSHKTKQETSLKPRLEWKQFATKVMGAIEAKGGTVHINELGRLFPRAIRPNATTSLKTQIKIALGEDIRILKDIVTLSNAYQPVMMAPANSDSTTAAGGSSPRKEVPMPVLALAATNSPRAQLQNGLDGEGRKKRGNFLTRALMRLLRWMVGLP